MKWVRCWARVAGSVSSQNRCPAKVVGMMDPAQGEGGQPRQPADRQQQSRADLDGGVDLHQLFGVVGQAERVGQLGGHGLGLFDPSPGSRMASIPPQTKRAASIGRASRRIMFIALPPTSKQPCVRPTRPDRGAIRPLIRPARARHSSLG